MNRLLLKECLDELRSDDSVELTEAHNNRRKEKKRTRGDSGRPLSGHSDRPRAHNSERSPTRVGLNAEQNLASLRQSLSQGRRLSQGQMLKELVRCLGGEEMDNYDDTRYYRRASIGTGLLRVGDHRGHADEFAKRGEWTGNYGIDINLPWSWRRFREDKRVDYKEEVYMPQDMTAENEIKIVDGVVNWIRTGVYTGPAGWETNISVRTLNLDGTPIQAPPQGGQPPTPPATPPTGPEVQESLAAKYFKEAHNMKYRLLKEAALHSLMEEDFGFSSFQDIPDDILDRASRRDKEKQESLQRDKETWKEWKRQQDRLYDDEVACKLGGRVCDVWFQTQGDDEVKHVAVRARYEEEAKEKIRQKEGWVHFLLIKERPFAFSRY